MKDEVPEGPTAAGQQELKERVIKKKKKKSVGVSKDDEGKG